MLRETDSGRTIGVLPMGVERKGEVPNRRCPAAAAAGWRRGGRRAAMRRYRRSIDGGGGDWMRLSRGGRNTQKQMETHGQIKCIMAAAVAAATTTGNTT